MSAHPGNGPGPNPLFAEIISMIFPYPPCSTFGYVGMTIPFRDLVGGLFCAGSSVEVLAEDPAPWTNDAPWLFLSVVITILRLVCGLRCGWSGAAYWRGGPVLRLVIFARGLAATSFYTLLCAERKSNPQGLDF